jgi:thiamine biosynthesis lipoprotein
MWPVLGTYVQAGTVGPRARAEAALAAAHESLQQSHARWSFQNPESELSRLNRACGRWLPLPPVTLRLLRLARGMTAASGGLFNCTVGGQLVSLGILPDHTGRPSLHSGCAGDIELTGSAARLRRPVLLTLDGIAKGYAVDLAVAALRRAGATGGWVNAGGDMRVFGDAQQPVERRETDGRRTPLGVLRHGALASSRAGPAIDPCFPGHLIGDGARHTAVWTVLALRAWRADALTKVAANQTATRRAATIHSLGGQLVPASGHEMAA